MALGWMQFGPDDMPEGPVAIAELPTMEAALESAKSVIADLPFPKFLHGAVEGMRTTEVDAEGNTYEDITKVPWLTKDEANKKYGLDGNVFFENDVTESEAQYRFNKKKEQLLINAKLSLAKQTFAQGAINTAAGVVANMVDPLNVASMFVPVVQEAQALKLAAMLGKGILPNLVKNAAIGSVEGAVGGAGMGVANFALSKELGLDYEVERIGQEIIFGAVGGAVLHSGIGFAKDVYGIHVEAKTKQGISDMLRDAEPDSTVLAQRIALLRNGLDESYPLTPFDAYTLDRGLVRERIRQELDPDFDAVDDWHLQPENAKLLDDLTNEHIKENLKVMRQRLDEYEAVKSKPPESALKPGKEEERPVNYENAEETATFLKESTNEQKALAERKIEEPAAKQGDAPTEKPNPIGEEVKPKIAEFEKATKLRKKGITAAKECLLTING